MSALEALLRLSALQAELFTLADALEPTSGARIVRHSARALNLVRNETNPPAPSREGRSVVIDRVQLRWFFRPWFWANASNDVAPKEDRAR
jgi:hypothetical protein